MSKQIVSLHRASQHAEIIMKANPGIRYGELAIAIMEAANCSESIAKHALTALRRSGNAVSTERYSEGYTWSDDGVPCEPALPIERIKRVRKNATECAAPVVNPAWWCSLLRVGA